MYDDESDGIDGEINDIEKKLENLQKIFCETIYEDVCENNNVEEDDLLETLKYFTNKEQYEKCIILKKYIDGKL